MEIDASPLCDGLHADLDTDGIAIRDRFLTWEQVKALTDCARVRRERGEFVAARIGAGRELKRRERIRGDSICWLKEPLFDPERSLLTLLEALRLQLNRHLLLGLFELELHFASYLPGAGYDRHIDQPQGQGHRRVTLALYLNEQWMPCDGGHLRIFADPTRYRDIEPLGGRLVLFLSARREHAVLPTRCGRLSLTGWFRSRE